MARTNKDTKVYAGGVFNKINHITTRGNGDTVINSMDLATGQSTLSHGLITRTTTEPPIPRIQQDKVKDNDV